MGNDTIILGAGITGLSAGMSKDVTIYEAKDVAGGICASYYVNFKGRKSYYHLNSDSYRFEVGGGHWIFGADKDILKFIKKLSSLRSYTRRSSVYFSGIDLYVPYPLQNHLSYLPDAISKKVLTEIGDLGKKGDILTLADWLKVNFGETLCKLFFYPFHELYTAGFYKKVAPQDKYKTPVNKDLIIKGYRKKTPAVGYNAEFVYPKKGLDDLINRMAEKCRIEFNNNATRIDTKKREILFKNGKCISYKNLISTLPLNRMIELTSLGGGQRPLPYTSVLVVNIGAERGPKCPNDCWLYIPNSKAGFHRVGFYSNVDKSFLPSGSIEENKRVSIYVEKAYKGGSGPSGDAIKKLCENIVKELTDWQFIKDAEVVDPTWIDIAYTWKYPDSDEKGRALRILAQHGISQIGRYGRWRFQGIAESMRDGFNVKTG